MWFDGAAVDVAVERAMCSFETIIKEHWPTPCMVSHGHTTEITSMRVRLERIFRSRAWLRVHHCAAGKHWLRWWIWRQTVLDPRLPARSMWTAACEVCGELREVHAASGPQNNERKWRRYACPPAPSSSASVAS